MIFKQIRNWCLCKHGKGLYNDFTLFVRLSFKESHRKRAQTYNASYVSCADDYTAYIIDEGKSSALRKPLL